MKKIRTGAPVAAALLLSGCATANATDPVSSPAATSSASTTATRTDPTPSPEDNAAIRAEEVLRAYYRAQTVCLSDAPKAELSCFDEVAIGTALTDMRNVLISAKTMQTDVNGDIEVVTADRTKVDLANDPTKTPPVVPQVTFKVCIDVSKFNIVDRDGKSIVPPDRPPRSVGSVVVVNYKYPDPGLWRVAYIVPDKGATC